MENISSIKNKEVINPISNNDDNDGNNHKTTHIYKIAHVVNNKITKIFVFIGKQYKNQDVNDISLDALFLKNPSHLIFDTIFTPDEMSFINNPDDVVQIQFIECKIHLDDTIETIKKKFMLYLLKETKTSFEELYFYFKKTERIDTTALYNNLTQNEKIDLTKERLEQFLSNIGKKLEDMLEIYSEDKTVYTYDDILKLNLDNKDFLSHLKKLI